MQHYGDNFIPVVPEDRLIHTADHPFCDNPDCSCHTDKTLVTPVLDAYNNGLLTIEETTNTVAGKML